jgi:hypothetical protein
MPVRPPPVRSTRSIVLGVVGLALGIVLVVALFVLAIPSLTENNRIEVRLGDDVFVAGDAANRSAAIAADGPILLPDVASGDRDVYLQHLGDDPATGWLVFDARRPGAGRDCTLVWTGGSFTDPCDGTVVPADGTGLNAYNASVNDEGKVEVDLVMRPDPTITTTSTRPIIISGN